MILSFTRNFFVNVKFQQRIEKRSLLVAVFWVVMQRSLSCVTTLKTGAKETKGSATGINKMN